MTAVCDGVAVLAEGDGGEEGVAEREGFEPSIELPRYGISSAAPSAGLGDLSSALQSKPKFLS